MISSAPPKIITFRMFQGSAEEATGLHTSLFDDAEVASMTKYGPEGPGAEGSVEHAVFTLAGQHLMAIDSAVEHGFGFTPAISLCIECDSEEEIERVWRALASGGEALMPLGDCGFSRRLGWLNDQFGVS